MPRDRAPTIYCIGGWVGTTAGLYAVEKKKFLAPTGTRTPTPRATFRYALCIFFLFGL
jgi:hypothetical protein